MFAMVRGHGISAFPNTVLLRQSFEFEENSYLCVSSGKKGVQRVSLVSGKVVQELIFTERDLEVE